MGGGPCKSVQFEGHLVLECNDVPLPVKNKIQGGVEMTIITEM